MNGTTSWMYETEINFFIRAILANFGKFKFFFSEDDCEV